MATESQSITGPASRRNGKDDVFCDLFSDKKNVLELYRSLHPEDTDITVDDLAIVTIERVLTEGLYNDLGFIVRNKLVVLVEAQSTWSVNIVSRMLLYLSETYRIYLEDHNVSLHQMSLLGLPAPELYVLYTGSREVPNEVSFTHDILQDKKSDIEVHVHVLKGGGEDIIGQYVSFTHIFDEIRRDKESAWSKASQLVETCIERGILASYFMNKRKEATDIMFTLFDQERETRLYHERLKKQATEEGLAEGLAEGRAEGRAEGIAEGRAKGRTEGIAAGRLATLTESVQRLSGQLGMSYDHAMDVLGVTDDEREQILQSLTA